jgi:succinate dehydrogenase / fumarate reductase membrane anchor subunit
MQVLIEDYVKGSSRMVAMLALNFYVVAGAAAAVFAVLKIALGAA